MREILFRGIRKNGEDFIQGFLVNVAKKSYIIFPIGVSFEVIPETVGQFTGLTDKNGKKIFEGDIIAHENRKWSTEVFWKDSAWRVNPNGQSYELLSNTASVTLINGNIHETPELLK